MRQDSPPLRLSPQTHHPTRMGHCRGMTVAMSPPPLTPPLPFPPLLSTALTLARAPISSTLCWALLSWDGRSWGQVKEGEGKYRGGRRLAYRSEQLFLFSH